MKISKHILRTVLVLGVSAGIEFESFATSTTYYSKVTTAKTGEGTAYVCSGSTFSGTLTEATYSNSSSSHTYSVQATPASGYHWNGWTISGGTLGDASSRTTTVTVSASGTSSDNPTTATVTASFLPNYYATLTAKTTSGTSGTVTGTGTLNSETTPATVVFNIMAPSADSGYHFTGWSGSGITFGETGSSSTTATVAVSSTGGSANAAKYEATANYAANYYVRVNTVSSPAGGGNSYVKYGSEFSGTATSEINGNGQGWAGFTETFTIKASPASNYHFNGWTKSGGTIIDASAAETEVNVNTTTGHTGTGNPAVYTFTANYLENIYYATLSANATNGTVTIAESTKSTTAPGGLVTFSITANPASGYHFVSWSTSGSGSFGSTTNASTTFSAAASNNYDLGNAAAYTITATFEKDQYNARLNTATSTALSGTSAGSAQVQDASSNWGGTATKSGATAGASVSFNIRAVPVKGYQFKGWSKTNGSTSYVSTTASTTYNVTAASVQGQTNTDNLYAVFDRGTYTIHFLGDSKPAHVVTGSQPDQVFTSGVAQNLNALSFVCNFTVTYDAQGGVAKDSDNNVITSETKNRFTRWQEWVSGTSVESYGDGESVNRTEDHGTTVNLTATWADAKEFVLPSATRTQYGMNYTFLGWYDAATGGNKVGDAGAHVNITASKTLYAHWDESNITINANSSSYTAGDKAVFNVTRSGTPATHYRIFVPIGGSVVLKDVPLGDYTVTPDSWSWNYTISPATSTKTVTSSVSFDFTVTTKSSATKHDEEIKTNTFSAD